MIEAALSFFETYATTYGYGAIFLITLLENSIFLGAFVPGETVAFLAGYYAAEGILNPYVMVFLLFSGSAIGDSIGFQLGKRKGKAWLGKIGHFFGYREEKIERAEDFWKDHGGKSIFLARFIAVARTFVPFLAGASKISYKEFIKYDLAGALSWALIHVSLGYFFGTYFKIIKSFFGGLGIILFLILIIVAYKYLVKKSINKVSEKE